MAHLRSQVFAVVKDVLAAIDEFSAPGKVERGRTEAVRETLLPALTLTWADRAEGSTIRPCATEAGADGYDRSLPLAIVVHLADTDPEEAFDEICVLVEAAMGQAITLDGRAIECTLASEQFFVNRETGLPLLGGSINYLVTYKTVAGDPETAAQ